MKREKMSQLSFGDLQMQRRKVKSEFLNLINAVMDWLPLCRPRGQKEYEMVEDRHENEQADTANAKLQEKPRPGVDTEARWVKKAGKSHFGYIRYTVVN